MTPLELDTANARRRQRIRTVSRSLMVLSLVAMLFCGFWTASTFVLPVVSKAPRYDHWSIPAEPAPPTAPAPFSKPRIFLNLSGAVPAYQNFDWDPSEGGNGIVAGRELFARLSAGIFMAYGVLGFWLLYRLFATYQRGDVFQTTSVRRLRSIGIWMMGNWALALAFNVSKTWWQVSPGFPLVGGTGYGLFAGLFICLIAWIMEEATLVAEEQALTI